MARILLKMVALLPEPLVVKFAKFYFNGKIKKHAKLEVLGLEYLNDQMNRPCLFVCNHISNADGAILNQVLKDEDPIFLAGKKLQSTAFTNLGLKLVKTIPIMANSPDKEAIKKVISTIKDGNSIVIFPEGTRSRTGKMIEAKKGILLIARMTKVPIVPIGIWGTEKLMPISDENMAGESFFDADVNVRIGEPFLLLKKTSEMDKGEWEEKCLNDLMQRIAHLLPEQYQGVYTK